MVIVGGLPVAVGAETGRLLFPIVNADRAEHEIVEATPADLPELLPLMRAYCDFYGTAPPDAGMEEMARALFDGEGFILLARAKGELAVGFATVDFRWSLLRGSRVATLEDLLVEPEFRGLGLADRLIEACADRAREAGAAALEWQTALDNQRAQAVYDRIGAKPSRWLDYELDLGNVPGREGWKGAG
jgi:GNAT superfamily N-acetyltransferase